MDAGGMTISNEFTLDKREEPKGDVEDRWDNE